MIGALAGSVLAITASALLVMGYRAWQDGRTAIDLQRDTEAAVDLLRRAIRDASVGRVAAAATNELRLLHAAGGGATRFYRVGRQLIHDPDTTVNGDQAVVVTDGVDAFRAQQVDNGIAVLLVVDDGQAATTLEVTTAHRN